MTSALYPTRLPCGNRVLDLAHTHVMGILNATPDSFSDGGRYSQLDAALRHAEAMVQAGATLIDVGGESTRPGARPVSASEEVERVAPVVEVIARELDVIISVDTSTPEVMLATAGLGAGLINDVRSLQRPGALEAAASTGLPVCLMHMLGEPGTMQDDPYYDDLVGEVGAFLLERINQCAAAGIDQQKIILDPGFGFAKTLEHNLSLFKHMEALHALGQPLLVGVSRKSMIGAVLGRPVDQRLSGGLALAALAMTKGVRILRVHDVAETADVVRMIAAVQAAE
ncbi:dihydropteroate synthase [Pseudomonas savastanoi pv. phaseolicola]|uniref:Dihydropteroate synthase n=6 Tax=Pseudomonas syringae group genomosp. 2 TaxID=251698 RepID=A0A0P9VQK3_PSEA0|nr:MULTISPECIES: dihydropteroate synthase [Pseudomonas]EGH21324.1 dihydropteroate synthase [Pseudomonas amygdali pv. mori str. 301020]KPB82500.1 Dihydropteroate synthase [Pseudomonas syringae pv. maculicola]AAZ35620.1 dihydropteroate synthase [Pseudomonas savastanoi pv. phaseolicola 1448A]EFW78627.1 dihydropteroate synthase [Pseudomonas savastanoi pv. glycinea str. B076]KPB37244.1 Dihydropteroate synthase [Pseudomonas savastanoi pv. phaseolicola]